MNYEATHEIRWVALDAAKGLQASPANLDRVCRVVGPEAARWAFAQWDLRNRAKSKFSRAAEMLFLKEALEQATSEGLANYHASLFPEGQLVADLTTGIGGDLIALARRGPTVGFELDPERAEVARHNVGIHAEGVEIRNADSLTAAWTWNFAIADPARRVEGRRSLDPSEFSPDPIELANRFAELELGVLKLSPLLQDNFLESLGPEMRFLSSQGECREALILIGKRAKPGRTAVHVDSGEWLSAGPDADTVEEPSEYFFDCDPACVRAHAIGTLAQQFGLQSLGDSRGYLTGTQPVETPWLRSYKVLYHGRADLGATKKMLIQLDSWTPEIKQRLAGQDLDQLRKALKLPGARQVSLAIWPIGRSLRHTILEQL